MTRGSAFIFHSTFFIFNSQPQFPLVGSRVPRDRMVGRKGLIVPFPCKPIAHEVARKTIFRPHFFFRKRNPVVDAVF